MILTVDDVKRVLDNFQKGYTERNLDNAKTFVNELFSSKEDCIVVGTGFAEWCKGKDEILELIEIDWQYWGNLSLDLDNAVITMAGEAALFNVAGDLSKGLNRELLFSLCTDKVKKELMSSMSNEDKV